MPGKHWTLEEQQDLVRLGEGEFFAKYPDRTENSARFKRARLEQMVHTLDEVRDANADGGVIFHDKQRPHFNWRDAIDAARAMQAVAKGAKHGQDFATIELDCEEEDPFLLFLSDTHIGDWATDYEAFARITDEIINTPGLYVGLLGDIANMAIKLRGVAEVTGGSLFTPELQATFFDSWLRDISHKVVFATWDNHAVEREESASGISAIKALQAKRVVYFGGIGHPDIIVGEQRYGLAVSHRFRGSSLDNPCHGPMRYLRREAPDRDLAAMGDYHVPGLVKFVHNNQPKVAINTGSTQVGSVYARRHYSLFTQAAMPGVVLGSAERTLTPYWSVGEWRRARQGRNS